MPELKLVSNYLEYLEQLTSNIDLLDATNVTLLATIGHQELVR